MKEKKIIGMSIIFLLTIIIIPRINALELYVNTSSSTCNNSGSRTNASNPLTAWCTLHPALNDGLAQGGDTIIIGCGEYNEQFDILNRAYSNNLTIRGINKNCVNLSRYLPLSNITTWMNRSNGIWETNRTTTDSGTSYTRVYFTNRTKFFTFDNYADFSNSPYPYSTYTNTSPSPDHILIKFNDTSINPNTINTSIRLIVNTRPIYIEDNNMSNNSWIIIENITFQYCMYPVDVWNTSNILITNNQMYSFDSIRANGEDTYSTNYYVINNQLNQSNENFWVADNTHYGIVYNNMMETDAISTSDYKGRAYISQNKIDNPEGAITLATNSYEENNGSEVSYNTITRNSGSAFEIEDYCYNSTWHHNNVTNCRYSGVSLAPANASGSPNKCQFNYNIINCNNTYEEDNYGYSTDYPFAIKAQARLNDGSSKVSNWNITHNNFISIGRSMNTMEGSAGGNENQTYFNVTWENNIFIGGHDYVLLRTGLSTQGNYYNNNIYYNQSGIVYLLQRWNNNAAIGYSSLALALLSADWDGTWDTNSIQSNPLFTDMSNNNYQPTISSPACGAASDGSAIGAVDCTATTSIPVINILSSPNGTITSDNTPAINFNFTDGDSSTANCTLNLIIGTCYQESANTSNQTGIDGNCGLNYSGSYTSTSSEVIDGDWDTGLSGAGFFVDYYKPSDEVFNSSRLKFKVERKGVIYDNSTEIPADCWSRNPLEFYTTLNHYELSIYCRDSGDPYSKVVYSTLHSYDPAEPETLIESYEEAMEWRTNSALTTLLGSNSSVINNTDTQIISSELPNGDYQAYVQCVDGDGNLANSSIISFSVDTEIPILNIINPSYGMNVSSNSINISFELLHETIENPLSYFNISLYDSDGFFNKTIQGNNSINTSYLWNGLLDGYSPGTYYIKIDAYDASGTIIASGNALFHIITDAILNVTAIGNGVSLSNFTITMSPGNSTITTSGSVVVGIFKNYTYNVTISDSGFASTGVSMNWSNDINYLLFNLTALANSVYIVFKDYNNLSVLSGINISLDYIGDFMSGNKSTSNGYMNLTGLTVGDYILRYDATGYETRFYSVSITDESTQNITLYMIPSSTSNNVTITVIDQNANPVMGAVVKALKYDLSSNSYLLQEIVSTDIQGRVIMSLSMYDEYYKFMVEYGGVLKVTTSPAYITSNSLTIQILIGELVGQEYYHYANIFADLTFNTITNNFRLDYDDTDGIVESVCLKVYTLGLIGEVPFNISCSSSASGTLLVPVDYINGTTYLAKAYYYEDGKEYFLTSKTYTFPGSEAFGKTYGLLLQIILTVFCAFIAVWSIPLAAILTPLSLVIGRMIHLNFFGWNAISAVFIIGLIIAYMTRKDA